MSKPYLRFEDGKISLGGKDLDVSSASLSLNPSLEPERVYGDYDAAIAGAKTEFVKHAAVSPLRGQLEIKFLINSDKFTTNNIDKLFDIRNGMNGDAIHGNIVGRYFFDNMYLKSFSFSLSPYSVIEASASYDIFGSVKKTSERRFNITNLNIAHGLKSFGEMKANNQSADNISGQFEISSLQYSIQVNRKVHYHIRGSEHSSVATTANGALPARVSLENIEAEMSVESNEIIPNLNPYGDYQSGTIVDGLSSASLSAFLYTLQGDKVAKFSCTGKIQSESLSISEGQYAKGNLTIREIIK
jgi:hypothetical protein